MKNLIYKNKFSIPSNQLYLLLLLSLLLAITGCQTDQPDNGYPQMDSPPPVQSKSPQAILQNSQPSLSQTNQIQAKTIKLREGDTVKISFPGSPSLDTTQQIRTDGKIVLDLVGEVTAAGKTPEELQAELLKLYDPQLTTKQIFVTVTSSTIQFYVIGAVLRSGPVVVDHPISVLDAIMEAGGFDETKANLKAVAVIRQENGRTTRYVINLKKSFEGKQDEPLMEIKSGDIVFVPERFTWF